MVVIRGREAKGKERGKGKIKEREEKISLLRCVWIQERKEKISYIEFVWFIKGREMMYVHFYIYAII